MSNQANQSEQDRQELTVAITGLRAACEMALDPNDLGRLAQMHTGCQSLAASGGDAGQLAAAVANLLEGIILKDAADADTGLGLIPDAVALLETAIAGESIDSAALVARIDAAATGESAPETPAAETPAPIEADTETPDANQPPPPPASAVKFKPDAAASVEPAPAAQSPAAPVDVPADSGYVSEPLIVDLSESDHLEGFVDEAREHMDAIEVALLEVEKDPTDTGKINELFRPFHTIKGIAGFLNLRDINRLTHEVETILDMGRKNELTITADTIDLVFAAIDMLKQQIEELATFMANPTDGPVPQPDIRTIMSRLRTTASGKASAPNAAAATPAPAVPTNTVGASNSDSGSNHAADTSIRVDTAKLDFLVDAVGELVIAQTMVNQCSAVSTDEKLSRDVSQVTKIVRDVQETAMAMRMVPIGHTFQKMRRLVRDVARKAGKQVELKISGEETELDKNVIQAISDPLVHMVRNAVDHGIGAPADRLADGKPETGTVHLHAFHQGDSIVIEIRDDGRGLDPKKLIAKGIERGLVSPDDHISDQEAFALIIQPGFSTAEQITDISGRGVGMDVVKRNVEQLRGKIEISSELGQGSVFSIRLPLTLAIIDGMLVRVGNERVIIPTILIEQSLRPAAKDITVVQRKGTMIQVRGELIPLVQIGPLFGFSNPINPAEGLVVVAQTESKKIGIVVDQLIGQQQVVIKTLGERFKHVKGVSGAAILGDGQVGLILEPSGLLARHSESTSIPFANDALLDAASDLQSTTPSTDITGECDNDDTNVAETAEPVAALD